MLNRPLLFLQEQRPSRLSSNLRLNLIRNMHYRNGTEAKNSDHVVQLDYNTGKITAIGILHDSVAGNDYCNGSIAPSSNVLVGACLCDCLNLDDVASLLAEKGLDKRPEGK